MKKKDNFFNSAAMPIAAGIFLVMLFLLFAFMVVA